MAERPTSPVLGCPDEHEPMLDWIGDTPFEHGERDDCEACFCGAPYYLHCEGWLSGGSLAGATATADGLRVAGDWRTP